MIKKQLGGDRIGSGGKMNVDLHGYSRSTHDLTRILRTTMNVGTIVPAGCWLGLPGDTWDIDIDALVNTSPTEGNLYGSFKFEVHVYKWPLRLGIAKLHMNLLKKGLTIKDIKFPQATVEGNDIDWSKNPDNQQVNPSSIWAYLGLRGIGQANETGQNIVPREVNALKYIAYWDIYKQYYANKQEGVGYVIHGEDIKRTVQSIKMAPNISGTETTIPETPTTGNFELTRSCVMRIYYDLPENRPILEEIAINIGYEVSPNMIFQKISYYEGADNYILLQGIRREYDQYSVINWGYIEAQGARPPKLIEFDLGNIDEMKMDILADIKSETAFEITAGSIAPYGLSLNKIGTFYSLTSNQEGLGIKTFLSDKYNNWLDNESTESINERTAIQIDGDGKFTLDSLILNQKMYNYLNRVMVAGGTVDDWREVTYDSKNYGKSEIPEYEGGLSKEIVFEQIVSTAGQIDQPLGTQATRGKFGSKHKGGKINIKCDEECYIMALASITPRIDYTQGNEWDTNLKSLEDLHKPEFDEIGFQNLITEEMAWWETKVNEDGTVITRSAGKQPAWLNYQTDVNVALGNFAEEDNEMYTVLARRYNWDEVEKRIKDLTTYIDPTKFNDIFSYKALDGQNFKMQIGIRKIARRKMSANVMPNMK